MKETELQNNGLVTALMFNQAMDKIDKRFDGLESKMMDGFNALDHKIDLVDRYADERHKTLSARVDYLALYSETDSASE